jgi:hypothetical protein
MVAALVLEVAPVAAAAAREPTTAVMISGTGHHLVTVTVHPAGDREWGRVRFAAFAALLR